MVFLVAVLVIIAVGITYAGQIQRGIGGSLIIGRVQTVDETIRVYRQITPVTADLTELNFGTADLNAFGLFTPLLTFPLWVENGGDVPFSPNPPKDGV